MDLKRAMRWLSPLLLVSSVALSGCVKQETETAGDVEISFHDQDPRAGYDKVLVFTPFTESAHALWSSMRSEVQDELDIATYEVNAKLSPNRMSDILRERSPTCVVLIGNAAVRVYQDVQARGEELPPAMVLMSSFAGKIIPQLRKGTGIAYEVPAVTSLVTLRQLSELPVERVGVLYRPALAGFIQEQKELAAMEEVELVGRRIEGRPTPRKIRVQLRQLLRNEEVDALWVINDNTLLNPKTIREAWLPEAEASEVPILVGVRSLVNARLSFGSVAVVPDHAALGVQAANLLFDLSDNEWDLDESHVELPLSVQTVVDMGQTNRLRLAQGSKKLIDVPIY